MSQTEAAHALGYKGISSIQRYGDVSDDGGDLSTNLVIKLVPVLIGRGEPPINADEVLALAGEKAKGILGEKVTPIDGARMTRQSRVAKVLAETAEANADGFEPRVIAREKDLRVFGAVEGGNDGMIVTPEPIDWMTRPQAVANAPDAFAVYVLGDSMEPRIEHGELVVVNPKKPVKRRDDVVLVREEQDGTWHALVKRIVRWTAETWVVQQYNPEKEFELPRAEWKAYSVTSRENV